MTERKRVVFTNEDFIKSGDVVNISSDIFTKEERIIKVRLSWRGRYDLDLSAIMLDENGRLHTDEIEDENGISIVPRIDDVVCFRSTIRWKANSEENILEGKIYQNLKEAIKDKVCKTKREYSDEFYPVSICGGVIGPRDEQGDENDDTTVVHEEELYLRIDKIDLCEYSSVAIIATISLLDVKDGAKFADIASPKVEFFEPDNNDMEDKEIVPPYLLDRNNPDANIIPRRECTGICLGFFKWDENGELSFEATERGYRQKFDENGGAIVPIATVANSFI